MKKNKKEKCIPPRNNGHKTNKKPLDPTPFKDPYGHLYKSYLDQTEEERKLEDERKRYGYYD
jgi:hypothetical protein